MNRTERKSFRKEVIGYFLVTDGTSQQQTVIISQETILDSEGVILETRKHLNLNSTEGEVVQRGDSDSTLQLADGTVLRKISSIQFGEPDLYPPHLRRRRQH